MKILIIAGMMLASGAAQAQPDVSATGLCAPAVAPAPYVAVDLPVKPTVPSCINMKTHMSTCSHAVLNKYNQAVEAHNDALQKAVQASNDYVDHLNAYVRAVNDYSNCELKRVNAVFKSDSAKE